MTRYGFVDRGLPLTLLGPLADGIIRIANSETAPAMLAQSLNWYVDLARSEAILTLTAGENMTDAGDTLVKNRQVVMWGGDLWDLTQIRNELGEKIGIVPYPVTANDSMANTNRAHVTCIGVSAGTAHAQAVWQLVNFLITRPSVRARPDEAPARPSVAEASGYWKSLDADSAAALRFALEHGWYGYITNEPLRSVGEALQQAIAAESDLATALAALQLTEASGPPPTADATRIVVATPEATPTPVALAADVVTVDYFVDPNIHTSFEAVKPLAEAFNQPHPGIVVRLADSRTAFGMNGYGVKEIAQKFDCFPSYQASSLYPYYSDQIYNLQPLLEADADMATLLADFYPAQLDLAGVGDQLYGLPAAGQPVVVYYNADHFAELGLKPPAPGWTVGDFWELAHAAAKDGKYGFVPYEWGVDGIEFLLAAENAELFDASVAPPVIKLDDPAMLRVVSQMAAMVETQAMFPVDDGGTRSFEGNYRQRVALIDAGGAAGRAAMWTNLAGFRYGIYTSLEGIGYKVGVAPVPLGAGPLAPLERSIALCISQRVKDPSACWEWIKFLSSHPGIFLGIPARRSVVESSAYETAVGPEAAATYRAVLSQPTRASSPNSQSGKYSPWTVVFWWQDALAEAFKGTDPAQALGEAKRKAEAYLACMVATNSDDPEYGFTCARQVDPDAIRFQPHNDMEPPPP